MDSLLANYLELSRYNRWMNERLYSLAASLSDEERKRPMGAFFGSIHGTFNHLLLSDRVWLSRFGAGKPPAVSKLSDELYAEFRELRDERAKTHAALDAYIAALTAESLGRTLTYKTTR